MTPEGTTDAGATATWPNGVPRRARWYDWWTDHGIPLPLIRHRGRGDLMATALVLSLAVVLTSLLFAGATVPLLGMKIAKIDSVVVLTVLGAATGGYVWKRGQDRKPGGKL